jgi:hypothetical protein
MNLFKVLRKAAEEIGIHFHFSNVQRAIEPSKPRIKLTFNEKNRTFDFEIPTGSQQVKEKEDLRKRFEELFGNLLPYSNKQVAHHFKWIERLNCVLLFE